MISKWAIIGCFVLAATTVYADQNKAAIFIKQGKAKLVQEDRAETQESKPGKWTRGRGYLESREDANTLFAGMLLGAGDFHVSARLTIPDLERDVVCLHVPEAIWSLTFNDPDGNISIWGRVTGKKKAVVTAKTGDFIKAGKPFLFEMIRAGKRISFRIDGNEFFGREWPDCAMGLFGFIVKSGKIRISDFRATGNLQKIPSQKELHAVTVFMCYEMKPDGSYVDGAKRFRIPALLVAPNGDLLAFIEARHEGGDHGNLDLFMKRSKDGGRTWSRSQLVYKEGGDALVTIGNPSPVVDQDTGIIWLPFCRENKDVFVTYSTDNGETWAKPTNITKDVQRGWKWVATGPGVSIQIRHGKYKGRMVVPYNHKPAGIFYSDDHGKSWHLGGDVVEGTDESQVVELADGTLLMESRGRAIRFHSSQDGGQTWFPYEGAQTLQLGGCQSSLLRYNAKPDDGKDLLLFSNPNHPSWRVNLTVRLSYDKGKTWPISRVIDPGSAQYSCLTVLPDGDIGLLYEDALKSRITFVRFNLDWITEQNKTIWHTISSWFKF